MHDPSNDYTTAIVLAVASLVAVPALPDASPVTLPVRFPMKVVDVVTPVVNMSPSGLRVIPDPTRASCLECCVFQ